MAEKVSCKEKDFRVSMYTINSRLKRVQWTKAQVNEKTAVLTPFLLLEDFFISQISRENRHSLDPERADAEAKISENYQGCLTYGWTQYWQWWALPKPTLPLRKEGNKVTTRLYLKVNPLETEPTHFPDTEGHGGALSILTKFMRNV